MSRPPKVDYRTLSITDECVDHQQKGKSRGKRSRTQGYGHIQGELLHRIVFEFYNGYLPVLVMHTCDNPRCINPKHLIEGTWSQNNKDRADKNRSAKFNLKTRKITQEQAEEIRQVYSKTPRGNPNSVPNLAKRLEVDPGTIYNILKGKTHFEYFMPRL